MAQDGDEVGGLVQVELGLQLESLDRVRGQGDPLLGVAPTHQDHAPAHGEAEPQGVLALLGGAEQGGALAGVDDVGPHVGLGPRVPGGTLGQVLPVLPAAGMHGAAAVAELDAPDAAVVGKGVAGGGSVGILAAVVVVGPRRVLRSVPERRVVK